MAPAVRQDDPSQLYFHHRPANRRTDLHRRRLYLGPEKERPVGFRRDRLGFIFQEFNLLDTLTAFDNIALALQIQRCAPKEIAGRVKEMAGKLGISDVLEKYPYQMSGGQKQRVAAARAIITRRHLSWRMSRPARWTPEAQGCSLRAWSCSTEGRTRRS